MTYDQANPNPARGLVGVIAATLTVLVFQLFQLLAPLERTVTSLPPIAIVTPATLTTSEPTPKPKPTPTVSKRQIAEVESDERFDYLAYRSSHPLTKEPPSAFIAAHGAMIKQVADRYGLPPALVYAVIATESTFNPKAVSSANAIGLMQIKYTTAKSVGFEGARERLFRPDVNVEYGTAYLAKAYSLSGGDVCRAVSRYNRGLGSNRPSPAYCVRVRDHMARYGHMIA